MNAEPRIVKKALRLIGMDTAIDFQTDFGPVVEALRSDVKAKLRRMCGAGRSARMVGFWFNDDGQIRYFAGVEAEDGVCDLPEGLSHRNLPESLYAVFLEKRRGEMGSLGGYAYSVWLPASPYAYNPEIPGDFEIFMDLEHTGPACEAEIYIPIVRK